MKRGPGPQRRTPLRADADKLRAFVQRGRVPISRHQMRAAPWRKPNELEPSPAAMALWRKVVCALDGERCIITGLVSAGHEDRGFHAHHVVPSRTLRARGLHAYRCDPRLGVWLSADAHERHEDASRRVPWTALPARVWNIARELDELDGTSWATDLILRLHPVRRDPAHSEMEVGSDGG